jgi:5'-3' exonuclease
MGVTTLCLDANQLCYRAKFTTGDLSHEDLASGVVFGFLEQLLSLGKAFGPGTEYVFCWDSQKSQRRVRFPAYKEKRRAKLKERTALEMRADELCFDQFQRLRQELLPRMGFLNQFRQTGYESDDLLAAMAARYPGCILVTSDQDLYQCLHLAPMSKTNGLLYTTSNLRDDLGCFPDQYLEAKIIAGCDTDEVPGVVGVGIPTALKWVRGQLKPSSKTYQKIEAFMGTADLIRNRWLIKLPLPGTRCPIPAKCRFDLEGFKDVCQEYGFASMLRNLRPWEVNFR